MGPARRTQQRRREVAAGPIFRVGRRRSFVRAPQSQVEWISPVAVVVVVGEEKHSGQSEVR